MREHKKYSKDNYAGLGALKNAIVLQVIGEYRTELAKLHRNHENKEAYFNVKNLENWFKSEWGELLSGFEGDYLIQIINDEFKKTITKKKKKSVTFL